MLELLSKFSIAQILLFIVLLAIAFKEVADFIDWVQDKIKKRDKKTITQQEEQQKRIDRFDQLEKNVGEMNEYMKDMGNKINILMDSDKDAIKAWITREHHYFCYQRKWIDDYSLDCLERRYSHYVEENGNSFISTLMDELRALPKKEPNDNDDN
jgi:hypothetical protein